MRIVGGKFKGRKLIAPEGLDTRPTLDRVRESVFNILEHQAWGRAALRGGRCADIFCGSGALGLEALSRGAAHVTFLDNAEAALKCLRINAKNMGGKEEISAIRGDVSNLATASAPYDIILMDAPYKSDLSDIALQQLQQKGWMKTGTLCVIETSSKENWTVPDGFDELDVRKYGAARVYFLQWSTDENETT